MAWEIDLTDHLNGFNPCSGCPARIPTPDIFAEYQKTVCPQIFSPERPCAWDEKVNAVIAFLEKANIELAKILR